AARAAVSHLRLKAELARARLAVSRGDSTAAHEAVARALDIAPDDGDVVAAMAALDVDRDHPDPVLAARLARGCRLSERFPASAFLLNAEAWDLARARRDLDRALVAAQRAVELRPASGNCRDTLAEVLFQRGDRAAALAEIDRAIGLDSTREYL